MNIYEKLIHARLELQDTKLKKSGQNTFAKYEYFELGDFLPTINKIMAGYKMVGIINFGEIATLRIVNAEKTEEYIEFTSPMSTAELKGCHHVQNLGAVQTYLRRYLYVNAFEIVEHDALDPLVGSDNKPKSQPTTPRPITQNQQTTGQSSAPQVVGLCSDCGNKITDGVKAVSEKKYGKPLCMNCQKKHQAVG